MKELLLVSLDGISYGIWKDSTRGVDTVKTSRRLSIAQGGLVTLSIVGDHTETLADLAVCLGHAETAVDRQAFVVRPSVENGVVGFLVRGEITTITADQDACAALPAFLSTPVISSCMVVGSVPVPLVDLGGLSAWLRRAGAGPGAPFDALPTGDGPDVREARRFRVFTVSGSIYAAACGEDAEETEHPGPPSRIPLFPRWVKGITVSRGRILPVVDLSMRLGMGQAREGSPTVVASLGREDCALLVDEDRGLWQPGQVSDLPQVARTPWMRVAVVQAGCVAPVLEPATLFSSRGDGALEELPAGIHSPDSLFPSQFNHADVDVLEFLLLGSRYAVPQTEVEGTFPLGILTEIPLPRKIVVGVTEHDGTIVPVLDLGRIYGGNSRPLRGMPLSLVRNGTFRALVMAGELIGARRIERASQRVVPVAQPYPAVYGCYLVQDSVRLVLNVEAIALNFGPDQAGPWWSELPQGLQRARTEPTRSVVQEAQAADLPAPAQSAPPVPERSLPELPAQSPLAAETPAQGLPARELPARELPARELRELPASEVPTREMPAPELPAGEPPAREMPAPELPAGEPPAREMPASELPAQNMPPRGMPAPKEPAFALDAVGLDATATGSSEPSAETPGAGGRTSTRRGRRRGAAILAGIGVLVVGLAAVLLVTKLTRTAAPSPSSSQQAPPALAAEQQPTEANAPSKLEIVVPAQSATDAESYVVVAGDTLWSISERLTGNPFAYVRIAGENRIANPDMIFPGQRIRIVRK